MEVNVSDRLEIGVLAHVKTHQLQRNQGRLEDQRGTASS
jgi:hypothetical protein